MAAREGWAKDLLTVVAAEGSRGRREMGREENGEVGGRRKKWEEGENLPIKL